MSDSVSEAELAATRRQLDEANERAAAAERRADEAERGARAELAREREQRFQPDEAPGRGQRRTSLRAPGLLRSRGEPADAAEPSESPAAQTPADEVASDDAAPSDAGGMVSLSSAGVDELQSLGMSVTQAKRVIRHREERGGFHGIEELDDVPGFPPTFLDQIKGRLVP